MAHAEVEERQLLKAMTWWDGFVIALANPGFLIAALGAAQLLGHLTLTMAGGHQASAGLGMVAAHAGAAVVLGVAIGAVEHLYLVCSSVLRWLRLFAAFTPRPALPRARRRTNNIVAQSLLWRTGLGMRAPPMGACATV